MEEDCEVFVSSDRSFYKQQHQSTTQEEFSEIGSHSPYQCYESNYVDNLLETSYVEFNQRDIKSVTGSNTYTNSGSSFFKRTDNLFFSDIGPNSNKTKMKHKKLQCQIGSNTSSTIEGQSYARTNQQKLQIFKMIKLLRLLFRQLKFQRNKVQKELEKEKDQFQQYLISIAKGWHHKISQYEQKQGITQMKMLQLESDLKEAIQENQSLRKTLEFQSIESNKKIRFIEEDNWHSFRQIIDEVSTSKARIEQMTLQISCLETQSYGYHDEVSHLSDAVHNRDVEINKLSYQNRKLQEENNELSLKLEQIHKRYEQCEARLNEQCLIMEEASSDIGLLNRKYKQNMRELEDCRQYIRLLQTEKEAIKIENQDFLIQQLQKCQQYFNEQYTKLKNQYAQQIKEKDRLIKELKLKEKIFMSVIAEKQKFRQQDYDGKKVQQNEIAFGNYRSQTTINQKDTRYTGITTQRGKRSSQSFRIREKENLKLL